jgi:hypothetical protein
MTMFIGGAQPSFLGEVLTAATGPAIGSMRDLDTIDSELRLVAAVWWSIREHGGEPSSRLVDELLDERIEISAVLYGET